MIPKSGNRFSDKIMLKKKLMIPKMPAPGLDAGWEPVFGGRRKEHGCHTFHA